jgi:hypothetical protein
MRIVSWYGAAFLALSALLSQSQTAAPPQESTGSASTQPTANSQAGESPAAEASASSVSQDRSGPGQKHPIHLRLGTLSVGAGYSHGLAYPYYPYYAYEAYGFYPYFGAYSPWLWAPFWSGYSAFADPADDKGEVRLTAEPKTAQVFLDGAYAGTADRLRSMWLAPGAYDLSVSTPNRESFHQRIYVLSGKSLKITAKPVAQNPAGRGEAKP